MIFKKFKGGELPSAKIWTFGSPCQDISIAGKGLGIVKGKRSSMFFEVIRLLKERIENKKTLPTYLIMENVKNLLSSNRGWDFTRVLFEMGKVGYDAEWSVLDSAQVVPQHRERIYIVGHLRTASSRKVFPIEGQNTATFEGSKVETVGHYGEKRHQSSIVYDPIGTSPTLSATDYKHPVKVAVKQVGQLWKGGSFGGNPQRGRVYSTAGASPTLGTMQGGGLEPKIVVKPCLTPDRIKKRQNGRRFKNNDDPSFTITVEDRNGVMIANKGEIAIRKLTPLECWRLQGFSDEQFYKAKQAGVSDSQLYKQAGNAVTTKVVEAIGRKLYEVNKY